MPLRKNIIPILPVISDHLTWRWRLLWNLILMECVWRSLLEWIASYLKDREIREICFSIDFGKMTRAAQNSNFVCTCPVLAVEEYQNSVFVLFVRVSM